MLQDGRGNTYIWNARHQLTEIDNGIVVLARFAYDGLGRRIGKTTGAGTVSYLYGGLNVIQEQTNGAVNNLLTGLEMGEVFARSDTPGRMYYLQDALNSTLALTDSTGAEVQGYAYDPYGNSTKLMSTAVTNPYTYTGQQDDGTGLYYYRARYYDPAIGRFTSEDPLGLGGGPDVYVYVGDDPLNETDPSGMLSLCYKGSCGPAWPGPPIGVGPNGWPPTGITITWPAGPSFTDNPNNPLDPPLGPPIKLPKCFPKCGDDGSPVPPQNHGPPPTASKPHA